MKFPILKFSGRTTDVRTFTRAYIDKLTIGSKRFGRKGRLPPGVVIQPSTVVSTNLRRPPTDKRLLAVTGFRFAIRFGRFDRDDRKGRCPKFGLPSRACGRFTNPGYERRTYVFLRLSGGCRWPYPSANGRSPTTIREEVSYSVDDSLGSIGRASRKDVVETRRATTGDGRAVSEISR